MTEMASESRGIRVGDFVSCEPGHLGRRVSGTILGLLPGGEQAYVRWTEVRPFEPEIGLLEALFAVGRPLLYRGSTGVVSVHECESYVDVATMVRLGP